MLQGELCSMEYMERTVGALAETPVIADELVVGMLGFYEVK